MGGGDKDLRFGQEAVQKITQGLRTAIGVLKDVSGGSGALMGKGFADLAMTGMEAGQHGLAEDFSDFCDRWDWGVRGLIGDADALAQRLGLAAGTQWEEDRYVEGALKDVVNSAIGDPHASEEQIEQGGWGDIVRQDTPDYGGWGEAADQMGQTWKDTARSVLTTGKGGMVSDLGNHVLGIGEDEWNQELDHVLGPSPEERAVRQDGQGQDQSGGN